METVVLPISRKGDGLKRVLFLCEDNYLLSRFCEELFNSLVRDEGLNWQAISRAVSPAAARRPREPMAADAVARLRVMGVAPVNHRRLPLGVNDFDIATCHAVFAVDAAVTQRELEPYASKLTANVEFWGVDSAQPVHSRLDRLAAAVVCLLDRVSGRACESPAQRGLPAGAAVASAKLDPEGMGKRAEACHVLTMHQTAGRESA